MAAAGLKAWEQALVSCEVLQRTRQGRRQSPVQETGQLLVGLQLRLYRLLQVLHGATGLCYAADQPGAAARASGLEVHGNRYSQHIALRQQPAVICIQGLVDLTER